MNTKHVKHFSAAHRRTIAPRTTNGTKMRFHCETESAGLCGHVPGTLSVRPGDGSRLSQGRFLFVPTKIFMLIGIFLAGSHGALRIRRGGVFWSSFTMFGEEP